MSDELKLISLMRLRISVAVLGSSLRLSGLMWTMTMSGLSRRKTRASEDPISPIPISATRSNNLALMPPLCLGHELGESSHHDLHLLAGADRDPEVRWQAVGAHLADEDAARLQKGKSSLGIMADIVGKARQDEIADARRQREADCSEALGQKRQPALVMGAGAGQSRHILDGCHPGRERRCGHVEPASA